jgi:hypothetical protein
MQPPPHASPRRAVSPWEKPSLLFPRQSQNDTHSALLSPHSSAPSAEAPTIPHRSRVSLRHAKPATEPLCTASNSQSTEPAASFGFRGYPPIEHHLQPPTCSSITAATSARAHRRSMNPSRRSPPLLRPAVAGSPPLTCVTIASPPR